MWLLIYGTYIIILLYCYTGGFAKLKKWFFKTVRKIPYVKRQVQEEIDKTASNMHHTFSKDLKPGMSFVQRLPQKGSSAVSI